MEIIKIREHPELVNRAAQWFHSKWKIPAANYEESICKCLANKKDIPQWYLAIENHKIIGGIGVIENDFHNRKDLTPNICALYVEKEYRCQGIAGKILNYVCKDMETLDINTLYLITDHSSFYEKYNWHFLCMVQEENGTNMVRMYIHKNTKLSHDL